MIRAVRSVSKVPLIASGGAGSLEDFAAALDAGADALLAASAESLACALSSTSLNTCTAECKFRFGSKILPKEGYCSASAT